MAVLLGYMYTPALAAVAVCRVQGRPLLSTLGLRLGRWPWLLVALLLPLPLFALMIALGALLPGVHLDWTLAPLFELLGEVLPAEQVEAIREEVAGLPIHPVWLGMLAIPVAGATLNALAAFGEEAGWRGLLYEALRPLGFWTHSLVVGLLWGIWHAPVVLQGYNFPEAPVAGAVVMTGATVAFSPLFTFLRARSRSVLSAAFLHGAFNAGGQLPMMVLVGGGLVVHPLGGIGILALGLANLVLLGLWLRDPEWVYPDPGGLTRQR